MREMTPEMAALLKSKTMMGENRPTHRVTIGNTGVKDFIVGDTWVQPSTIYTSNSLSVAKKANGKLIICNMVGNEVYEAESDTTKTLLTADDGAINWIGTGIVAHSVGFVTVWNLEGDLYLTFSDKGEPEVAPARYLIYKSPSGNGGDWQLYSVIENYDYGVHTHYSVSIDYNCTGIPIKLKNGNWVMNCGYFTTTPFPGNQSLFYNRIYIMTSSNNGITWARGYWFDAYMVVGDYYASFNKRIVQLENGELYSCWSEAWGDCFLKIIKSSDNGLTWEIVFTQESYNYWNGKYFNEFAMLGFGNNLHLIGKAGNKDYIVGQGMISVFNNLDNLLDSSTLAELPLAITNAEIRDHMYVDLVDDTLLLAAEHVMIGIKPIKNMLQAKKIDTQRQKGMAGGLTIDFDNKKGILAPDGLANEHLLWPNKEIIVEQGYGDELLQTFKGYIDSISMQANGQQADISISARDSLKRALDQTITTNLGDHVITALDTTVEALWTDLATMAGLTIGVVEETGITLSEKVFSWETYGDAFSFLDELVGFETVCDWEGKTHFRRDGRPETVDIAWTFREGEDIIQLGYEINDRDLYRQVIVHGKKTVIDSQGKEVDEVIEVIKDVPNADYYNILPHKILKIDAPDADTVAKCEIIADKAIYLMTTRARIVQFQSIGIPHLERGDFIEVIESSTTISEIYRITDITTTQTPETYTINITCYHHAAPEVEE